MESWLQATLTIPNGAWLFVEAWERLLAAIDVVQVDIPNPDKPVKIATKAPSHEAKPFVYF